MPVQIQLTAKDYRRALRAHLGWKYFFFYGMGALAIALGVCHSWIRIDAVYGICMIGLGIGAISFTPLIQYQCFKSNRKLTTPWSMTASSEGIETSSEYGNAFTRWTAFVRFVENKELILLYTQPLLFYTFPKRFFLAEQLEEFERLVRTHISPIAPKNQIMNLIRVVVVWMIVIVAIWVLYQVLRSSGR